MHKVLPDFIVYSLLILSSGVFFSAFIKLHNNRMDRTWTIHDCVMEKWRSFEDATGIMPAQQDEQLWRDQCTQEWSAMPTKPS